MRPDAPRDPIAGPDTPEKPYPLKLSGKVIKGFGRGSKEVSELCFLMSIVLFFTVESAISFDFCPFFSSSALFPVRLFRRFHPTFGSFPVSPDVYT